MASQFRILVLVIVIASVTAYKPLRCQKQTEAEKSCSGQACGNRIDCLRRRLGTLPHIKQRLLDAVHQSDGAVLHAAYQDVRRCLAERQDALHRHSYGFSGSVTARLHSSSQFADGLRKRVRVAIGGLLCLTNGIFAGFFDAFPRLDHLRRDAVCLAVLRHSVSVVGLGEPRVLRIQRLAVGFPRRLKALAYLF